MQAFQPFKTGKVSLAALAAALMIPPAPALAREASPSLVLERIELVGNKETQDFVIRRELTQKPGDALDVAQTERDLARLYKLGYFDRVGYELLSGVDPLKRTLRVSVQEKQTWMVFPVVGYTSLDGLIGTLNFKKDNLLGRSQSIGANLNYARNYYYYFTYNNPWLDDAKTSLDSTLFAQHVWNNFAIVDPAQPGLIIEKQGLNLLFGRPLGEAVTSLWQGSLICKIERTALQDFNGVQLSGARAFASGGNADLQVIGGYQASFDSRDLNLDPHQGWYNTFNAEQFVPGLSAANLTRLNLSLNYYVPVFADHTLALGGKLGTLFSLNGGPIPPAERIFPVVEKLVRGWPENPSPKQLSEYPLGSFSGDSFGLASAEYRFPIVWLLSGVVFAESGLFWDQALQNFSWSRMRSGYGAGLRLNMPALGPLRFDYGLREWDFRTAQLQIAIGHKF